jgi:hypothetical protein
MRPILVSILIHFRFLPLRFGTGNPQVGISHTVPILGTGTYRTVIYMVSNGYLTDLVGGD